MTTLIQVLRYESGMVGEEAADLIESLEKEIDILRDERDVITKERDELREQVRQHEAFQQWANVSEQRRLNDARREGWNARAANGRLTLSLETFEYRAGILDGSSGKSEQYDEGFCDGAKAMRNHIRAMQLPAEWSSSELCGGAPNNGACKCTFAQRMVGDGCDICNPELAKELSQDE